MLVNGMRGSGKVGLLAVLTFALVLLTFALVLLMVFLTRHRPPKEERKVIGIAQAYSLLCGKRICPMFEAVKEAGPEELFCDGRCRFLGMGRDAIAGADVAFWDAVWDRVEDKRVGRRDVGVFFESPSNWRILSDGKKMSVFDYEASYRPKAAIPIFLMITDTVGDFTVMPPPMPFSLKRKNVMVTAWISNCQREPSRRLKMASQLAQFGVSIRNFGACQLKGGSDAETVYDVAWEDQHEAWRRVRSRDFRPPGSFLCPRCQENIRIGGSSLFYLAAENSMCEFYHTEKAYLGLLSGAVPIYIGHPTAKQGYFPDHSVIFASDFSSTAALAAHLRGLAANETAYNSYLTWRTKPIPPSLQEKIERGLELRSMKGFCSTCDFLHRHWNDHSVFRGQNPRKCHYASPLGDEVQLRQLGDGSLMVVT